MAQTGTQPGSPTTTRYDESAKSQEIYSDYVLFQKRERLRKDLRENVVGKAFAQQPDSNNEHRFESACKAISQFLFKGEDIKQGFGALFTNYASLQVDTRQALLEAVYAVYPNDYAVELQTILTYEIEPLLFSMVASYLVRARPTVEQKNDIKIALVERFPGYDSLPMLTVLEKYIDTYHTIGESKSVTIKTPEISTLFRHQAQSGRKTIYSLQRWNRDYPGIAIIQHANGKFARDADGRLLVFQQLARSASNLPFFITNGSTPQGIFSLQGTAVSRINWIGPTPNIQMLMPFESSWEKYYHQPLTPVQDSFQLYRQLLPKAWQNYLPMFEAWQAGKVGRSEIIAHGTTIDPAYYEGQPFYPLTPTMGCLCAREQWNVTTGRLLLSEQYGLANTYVNSPGKSGYLYVINIDHKTEAVTRAEVEKWVQRFEASLITDR